MLPLLGVAYCVLFTLSLRHMANKRALKKAEVKYSSSHTSIHTSISHTFTQMGKHVEVETWTQFFQKLENSVWVILYLMYPTVSRNVLNIFVCDYYDGLGYLRLDHTVRCCIMLQNAF